VTSYTYDPAGNRLTLAAPGASINYAYDADDRLLSAGNITFAYDANGNRIKETDGDGTVNYAYDLANRLMSVAGGGQDSAFAYDGDGNRISQSAGAATYAYLNDVGTALPVALQESGPDGNINYDYGLGLVSEASSAFDYFYQYDGLGAVVGLTEPNGKLAGRYTYDAWGNAVLAIPDNHIGTENKFRFTGEALDPGTQLYYLRARYYDPNIGRFIGPDPFPAFVDAPRSMEKYLYVFDNPLRLVDPSGLSAAQPSGQIGTASLIGSLISQLTNPLFAYQAVGPATTGLLQGVGVYAGLPSLVAAGASATPVVTAAATGFTAGRVIGSIPTVRTFVSNSLFWALNKTFGPTQVQAWSTSQTWNILSSIGDSLVITY
jgi:RHS repeat-associated protein